MAKSESMSLSFCLQSLGNGHQDGDEQFAAIHEPDIVIQAYHLRTRRPAAMPWLSVSKAKPSWRAG